MHSLLAKAVASHQRGWPHRLPYVTAAYNSSVLEAHGFTPNFLTFGRHLAAPIDVVLCNPSPRPLSPNDYAEHLVGLLSDAYDEARVQNEINATTIIGFAQLPIVSGTVCGCILYAGTKVETGNGSFVIPDLMRYCVHQPGKLRGTKESHVDKLKGCKPPGLEGVSSPITRLNISACLCSAGRVAGLLLRYYGCSVFVRVCMQVQMARNREVNCPLPDCDFAVPISGRADNAVRTMRGHALKQHHCAYDPATRILQQLTSQEHKEALFRWRLQQMNSKKKEALQARGLSSGWWGHGEAGALPTAIHGRDSAGLPRPEEPGRGRSSKALLFRSGQLRWRWGRRGGGRALCLCGPLPHWS